MSDFYEIVVVGAGPAGAACARYIAANSKHTVLLLDKTQEIGEPKKSTAGTFSSFMTENGIPESVAMSSTDELIFESPTESTSLQLPGYVLEFAKFKKFLVEEAVQHGADLRIESSVNKCIVENGRATGVEYHDLEGIHTVNARIVVDATGPAGILATQMGLRPLKLPSHAIGMEFEMEKLNLSAQKAMLFKFDTRYAPGGYSWIFSTGLNKAKVGVCWYDDAFVKQKGKGSQISYLDSWIKQDTRLTGGITMEMHAGDASAVNVKKRSANGFMAVGDAVGSIHPLFMEGIRPCVLSGVLAAQTAIKSLDSGDISSAKLSEYDSAWHEKIGKHRRIAEAFTRRMYMFNNKQYDILIKNLKKLDAPAVKRFLNYQFNVGDLFKLYPKRIF